MILATPPRPTRSPPRHTVRLHRRQHDYRTSPALYRGFVGGRGAGKSWVGAYDLIRRSKPGRHYMVGSPTGVMMGDTTYPTFKAIAEQYGVWGGVKLSPYPNATLTNGATIRFRTAEDPEKMRGPNLSGIWLDEASLMKEAAYTICIASLRENGEQGWLGATYTPKGKYHWTYETFFKKSQQPGCDTAHFTAHTRDNPFNPKEFADTLARQYTALNARQELGGEYMTIEGAEWASSYFPDSIWFDRYPTGVAYLTVALDPSKGRTDKSDYSALVSIARDKDGHLWIEADLERRDTSKIVRDGVGFGRRLRQELSCEIEGFGIEGDMYQDLLADLFTPASTNAGYPLPIYKVFTEGVNKEVRIRRLTPLIVQGKLHFRNTPGTRLLVQQMQEFPVGEHDDGPDALEMCYRLGNRLIEKKSKGKRW